MASTTSTYPTTKASSVYSNADYQLSDYTHTDHTSLMTHSSSFSKPNPNPNPISYDQGYTDVPLPDEAYGGVEKNFGLLSIPEKVHADVLETQQQPPSPFGRDLIADGSSSGHTRRAVSPLPHSPPVQVQQPSGYQHEYRHHASSSNLIDERHEQSPSWAADSSRPWVQTKLLLHQSGGGDDGYYYDEDLYGEYGASSFGDEEEEEMNEIRFFNPAYLSEMAVQVRDRVIRGHHVKGGITWVGTFTGKDLIVC